RNVASLARPPRAVHHELRVLSADETRKLLAGTAGDELGPLYAVAATTGLRQGELFGLSWSDVDLGGRQPTLTVRRSLARGPDNTFVLAEPKTSTSRRTLELPPSAVAAFRERERRQAASRMPPATCGRTATGSCSPTSSGAACGRGTSAATYTR